MIQELTPGLHIQFLQEAAVKAFDLSLTLKNNINMTKDFEILDDAHRGFQEICETLQDNPGLHNIVMSYSPISSSFQ